MAADALGRNQVWPGTAENSEEENEDSGCEDACFIADEYREERMFEDEFCDPMLEELFAAAKDNQAYQKVLVEVNKGLTKEALKLLPPDHPARAMTQQCRGARTGCWCSRARGSWCQELQERRSFFICPT